MEYIGLNQIYKKIWLSDCIFKKEERKLNEKKTFSTFSTQFFSCLSLVGSTTLHHWQRLAQPRIEGLFEPRPGVHNRGEKADNSATSQIYSLSDYEEDGTFDSAAINSLPPPLRKSLSHTHERCITSGFCLCSVSGDDDFAEESSSSDGGEGEKVERRRESQEEYMMRQRNARRNRRNEKLSNAMNLRLSGNNNSGYNNNKPTSTSTLRKCSPKNEKKTSDVTENTENSKIQNGRRIENRPISYKNTTTSGHAQMGTNENPSSNQVARKVMGLGEGVMRSGAGSFFLGIRRSLGLVVIKCDGAPDIQQLQSTGYLHMVGKPIQVPKQGFSIRGKAGMSTGANDMYSCSV